MPKHRIVDLTHKLFPGKEERKLEIKTFFVEDVPSPSGGKLLPKIKREKDVWYIMQEITLLNHIGTHIEAPYHYLKDGKDASEVPLERVVGEAVVLDFIHKKPNEKIELGDLEQYGKDVHEGDIVLIRTGRSKFWNTEDYHQRPFLTNDAVKWLVGRKISCLGIDASGIEVKGIDTQPNHKTLFENDIPVIENLTNLDRLNKKTVFFMATPLKIDKTDASLVRAVAIES